MRLRPVGDQFILVPDKAAEESEGGIILTKAAQEKPKTGKVIAVGDGLFNTLRGEYIGMPVKAGERIIYKPFAGLEIELEQNGETATALLLKSEDIMAVMENDEGSA